MINHASISREGHSHQGRHDDIYPNRRNAKGLPGTSICHVCGKVFVGIYSKYNLKRHMMIHFGMKPFVCAYCNKSFNQKSNMDNHKMVCKSKPQNTSHLPVSNV